MTHTQWMAARWGGALALTIAARHIVGWLYGDHHTLIASIVASVACACWIFHTYDVELASRQ